MRAITFDTLKATKNLISKGFTEDQAVVLVEFISTVKKQCSIPCIILDTHAFFKKFLAVGFSEKQAEALVGIKEYLIFK